MCATPDVVYLHSMHTIVYYASQARFIKPASQRDFNAISIDCSVLQPLQVLGGREDPETQAVIKWKVIASQLSRKPSQISAVK